MCCNLMIPNMLRIVVLILPLLLGTGCRDRQKKSAPVVEAMRCTIEVVNEYPHSTESYTQGLFFHDGRLYESTGQYGYSYFCEVDIPTGERSRRFDIDSKYFGEGSVIFGGKLYYLTWRNYVTLVYDAATLKFERSIVNPREGWGLTTDGKSLIMSDGSSNIYFLDANFKVQRRVVVKNGRKSVGLLNELEWIDGKIWANVYMSDSIVVINPENGVVEKIIDCRGLLREDLRTPETDVLNGIAYNPETGKIYVTGKLWPRLFEIKVKDK